MQTRTITSGSSWRHSWLVRAAGALLAIGAIAAIPTRADARVFVSINIAPPILPLYAQPMIPGPGYLWTPGYWAWGGDGYYWVPGAWVLPPYIGALWTPGYWGWGDGGYFFHRGYWGRHVGFYGGIDYGYGYGGRGYEGGYWRGGGFYYNRNVNRIGGNIRNVYSRNVIRGADYGNSRRVSFNGGRGGISARPTSQERGWDREQHRGPVAAQLQQRNMASRTSSMRSNGGLRSAGFAPHSAQAMRSSSQSRYGASTSQRSYARPESSYSRGNANSMQRGTTYQPQDARATRYQPQSARPAQNYARGGYRPANGRPAGHAAAPRGRAAPAKHGDHHDNQHR